MDGLPQRITLDFFWALLEHTPDIWTEKRKMQQENSKNLEFRRRTERLADFLNCKARDLPQILGISKSLYYGACKGKPAASLKTWNKLQEAERRAGIDPVAMEEKKLGLLPSTLQEPLTDYGAKDKADMAHLYATFFMAWPVREADRVEQVARVLEQLRNGEATEEEAYSFIFGKALPAMNEERAIACRHAKAYQMILEHHANAAEIARSATVAALKMLVKTLNEETASK